MVPPVFILFVLIAQSIVSVDCKEYLGGLCLADLYRVVKGLAAELLRIQQLLIQPALRRMKIQPQALLTRSN